MNLGAFAVIAALQKRAGVTSSARHVRRAGPRASRRSAILHDAVPAVADRHPADRRLLREGATSSSPRSQAGGWVTFLAVIAVLNAAAAAFYYLRVVVYMYMREPGDRCAGPAATAGCCGAASRSATALTILLGFFPG